MRPADPTEGLVAAAVVVSALAFAADGALSLLQRSLTPAPLRRSAAATRVEALQRPL